MSIKIRKFKKRLYEADGDSNQQNNQGQQPQGDANQTQPNNANPQQPAQPANNAAPQGDANQTQPQNNQPQQPQNQEQNNNQNQEQQQEDPKLAENREKAATAINNISEVISKNDPYALLALNIPDVMMQAFPNLKDDPNAKDTMTKWEEFKKAPSKQTFDGVMDAFSTFANGGKPVEQNANQNQQNNNSNPQPAQPTAQNQNNNGQANESIQMRATKNQMMDEYKFHDFSQRLNEKLNGRKEILKAQEYVMGKKKPIFNLNS